MRVEMRAGSDKECSSAEGRLWGGSADNVWDVVVVELRELPAMLVEREALEKLLDDYLNQDRSSGRSAQAWLWSQRVKSRVAGHQEFQRERSKKMFECRRPPPRKFSSIA